nr:phage-related tail fiber protein [uncultured Mediterranean phage uvMED]BAR25985.1 phage-related tail fiber protein [uncultured Mediterranean phage uvMED]BAR25992.1 phage-related tail fiber protein [uncultured Mediterranean phage uvMED]BAR26043.1 phage-related tail fiber protein [uncultured Mediterranean phage uvMED]BAR26086.1 phage-related tail fiber protein [uncultured Mediterranean phage uvMED]
MSNTIRIKRRTSGASGAPSSLANSELAFNEIGDVLYYGKGTGGAGGSATTVEAIGGSGAFLSLSGTQTVTGNKTFSGSVALGSSATASTPSSGDDSTSVATTAYVQGEGFITGNETITVSGDASGSGTTSISLTLANSGVSAGTTSGITVNAKGLITGITSLVASDIPSLTAAKISDFDSTVQANRLDEMANPTGSVDLNSQKITNLATPTAASDAATKGYVDASQQGLDVKESVKAATTGNITLSGTQTIDGVSLSVGDRVLVKNQTTGSENGIYVVASSGWSRAADADADSEVTAGLFTFVEEGTVNGDAGFSLTTNDDITVGTTALSFSQFSGAGNITGGDGIQKSGSELSIDAKANGGLVIESSELAVDLGASSITGTLAVTDGGTGGTSASAARTNLGVAIGSDVQAHGDVLDDLSGLTQASNKGIFFDTANSAATFDLTSAGRALLDDADASAQRTTLGLAIGTDVQAYDAELAAIAGLTSAANKLAYFTGSGTADVADFTAFARTLLDDANASTARTTLGVAIGSDVQAYNASLATIGSLATTDGAFIVGNGSSFTVESGATARTSLGLGSIATQASSNVSITGGSISGIELDGGTF